MAAASAVFGQRGKRDAALVLREEGERGEGVVELAGWFQAGQGEGEGMTRSGGSARLRRGASSAVLGVRARGGTAWRGRAGWGGRSGRTRWRGGRPGRAGGARPAALPGRARDRGGEREQRG